MADTAEFFFNHFDSDSEDEFYRSEIDFEDEEPIFSPRPDDDPQFTISFDPFGRSPPSETLDTFDFGTFREPMAAHNPWLGLGLGFEIEDDNEDEDEHEHERGANISREPQQDTGLRIAGFESDSDPDPTLNPETDFRSCWGLEEDLEWEEVDGCIDERDFLSTMVGQYQDDESDEEEEARNWEILLSIGNVEPNTTVLEEEADFVNANEYEILYGQFGEYDSLIRGTPPAAKQVVDNLPTVVLCEEDMKNGALLCAVCKDDMGVNEKVKQLPCMHFYHGECILPWLKIRNTCPVCRFELLTDNVEYESWRIQTRERDDINNITEDYARYEFEMFSDTLL